MDQSKDQSTGTSTSQPPKEERCFCPFGNLADGKKALCVGDCSLAVPLQNGDFDCAFAIQARAAASSAGAIIAIADFLGKLAVVAPPGAMQQTKSGILKPV